MKAYHNKEKGIGITYDDIYPVNGAHTAFGKLCRTFSSALSVAGKEPLYFLKM